IWCPPRRRTTLQPRLSAKSLSSSSDISRRTLSSAGCVTKYSDLVESISAIFAANASECAFLAILISARLCAANRLTAFERILSLAAAAAVSICDLISRAERDALFGPPWGLSRLAFPCRFKIVGRLCQTPIYYFGARRRNKLPGDWRGQFDRLSFGDVFRNHRAARSHY